VHTPHNGWQILQSAEVHQKAKEERKIKCLACRQTPGVLPKEIDWVGLGTENARNGKNCITKVVKLKITKVVTQ